MSEILKFRIRNDNKSFEIVRDFLQVAGFVTSINGCVVAVITISAKNFSGTVALETLDLDDGEYVSSHPLNVDLSSRLTSFKKVEVYLKLPSGGSHYPIKTSLHYIFGKLQ